MMKKRIAALAVALAAPLAWAAGAPAVSGKVLEVKDVEAYTYLRLKTTDGEVWAATMLADYPKGTKVQLHDPMLMTNFESRALNRSFDEIVFASVVSTEAGGMVNPAQQMAAAHKGAATPAANLPVVKVPKATSPNARTVAEIHAQRAALNGKTVAVQGTVVKFSADIMDRNWIHLRDGSGSAADRSNDLMVTTTAKAKVGDVVVASGVVKTNADYGSGYAYPVVIEGATLKP